MANVKELVRTIIRETCTHWICADEQELERVETELEQKLKGLVSSELALAESSPEDTAALPLQNVSAMFKTEEECITFIAKSTPFCIKPTRETSRALISPFTSHNAFKVVTEEIGKAVFNLR